MTKVDCKETSSKKQENHFMNKNQIFSAIKRGFEISGINALSMAAGSPSVNKALQEMIDEQR